MAIGAGSGWRGPRGEKTRAVRHRWQKDWTVEPLRRVQARDLWRRFRVLGLLVASLALVALFVYNLLYAPEQTPLVTLCATQYAWPLPPNAWAREDLDRLAQMDGQTVALSDVSAAWENTDAGLESLERRLAEAARRGPRTRPMILHLSMHGAVDGNGAPCLIPPAGSPLRTQTWLPVAELWRRIDRARGTPQRPILLILDCNRLRVDWRMGLLHNNFAQRLRELAERAAPANLWVLNSASPGESAWFSPDLQASVFGHFLHRGLAGEADQKEEGGNGNGRVSLHELLRYLQRHVDGWVVANRAERQRPMLVPANPPDLELVFALHRRARRAMLAQGAEASAASAPAGAAAVPAALHGLWRTHDHLLAQQPNRFAPLAWRDFQHKLLWLEELVQAGRAYEATARSLEAELLGQAAEFERRAAQVTTLPTWPNLEQVLVPRAGLQPKLSAHALPTAQRLGGLAAEEAEAVQAALDRFRTSPTPDTLAEAVAQLDALKDGQVLAESYFLRYLHRYQADSWWQHPELLRKVVETEMASLRAAAPLDERGLTWVLPALRAADQLRRAGQDALFVGDDESLKTAREKTEQALARLTEAEALSAALAQAWALRDGLRAELPYLAQWFCRPCPDHAALRATDQQRRVGGAQPAARQGPIAAAEHADELINQTVLPLIEALRTLEQALAAPSAESDAHALRTSLAAQVQGVQAAADTLRQTFRHEIERLLSDSQLTPETLCQVQAVLRTPLVPAHQRDELRQLVAQSGTRFHSEYRTALAHGNVSKAPNRARPSNGRDETAGVENPAASYLDRMLGKWQEHPALAILKPLAGELEAGAAPGDLLAASDAAGQQVREILVALPATLRHISQGGAAAEKTPTEDASWRALFEADALARVAAAWHFDRLERDPAMALRRFGWQQFLAWQAERTVDDFWGTLGADQEPFFGVVAGNYLTGARGAFEGPLSAPAHLARLAELLQRRRTASREALLTAIDQPPLLTHRALDASATIEVRPASGAARDLPQGTATVFVRDQQVFEGSQRPLALPLPDAADQAGVQIRYDWPGEAVADRGPQLAAVTMFRGNEFPAGFLLRAAAGTRIELEPHVYGPPQVTLHGRVRQRVSTVLILDCSQSMSRRVEIESPGEGRRQVSRLDVAKNALVQMLARLAQQGDARVGVRFYGHRAGWNVNNPTELLLQTDYGRDIPDNLQPSEDVELVLPLGRFDEVIAGGVADLLKSVKPWGESPLYLAMTEALGDFAGDEPETAKSIVVITDGANYQFNSQRPRRKADVLAAAAGRNVPIHIVGFQIPEDEAAQARREFTDLARQTGGSFTSVESATALVESLRQLLSDRQFRLLDQRGSELGTATLGVPIVVTPPPEAPRPFTLAFEAIRAPLVLAGGEALEFTLDRDGGRVIVPPFTAGNPRFVPLVQGLQQRDSGLQLGLHRPVWQRQGVQFTISLQSAAGESVPRPAAAWIEITPLRDRGRPAGDPYLFYDANWEPDRPVPVLKLLAAGWPADAREALVHAWLRPSPPDHQWDMRIGDLASRRAGDDATLEGLPGVELQVRIRRPKAAGEAVYVHVVERHASDSPGIHSLQVTVFPPGRRVVHLFDPRDRVVVHTFEFVAGAETAVADYPLRLVQREVLHRDAWHLKEAARVSVGDPGEVLQGVVP